MQAVGALEQEVCVIPSSLSLSYLSTLNSSALSEHRSSVLLFTRKLYVVRSEPMYNPAVVSFYYSNRIKMISLSNYVRMSDDVCCSNPDCHTFQPIMHHSRVSLCQTVTSQPICMSVKLR